MALKVLNLDGVKTLWNKVCDVFAKKTDLAQLYMNFPIDIKSANNNSTLTISKPYTMVTFDENMSGKEITIDYSQIVEDPGQKIYVVDLINCSATLSDAANKCTVNIEPTPIKVMAYNGTSTSSSNLTSSTLGKRFLFDTDTKIVYVKAI